MKNENITLLAERFENMAKCRREEARDQSRRQYYEVAHMLYQLADAYQRCADEVRRVLDGETPAPVGEDWRKDEPQ